jgi:phage shock protein E
MTTDRRAATTLPRRTARAFLLLTLLLAGAIAACGGSGAAVGGTPAGGTPANGTAAIASAVKKVSASEAVAMLATRVVIDVRTPSEFAAGHVAKARNIDVQAGDFAATIATLDKSGAYLVYCHSGRRSALAAGQMAAAGFVDIVDGGAMDALVAAGAPKE